MIAQRRPTLSLAQGMVVQGSRYCKAEMKTSFVGVAVPERIRCAGILIAFSTPRLDLGPLSVTILG